MVDYEYIRKVLRQILESFAKIEKLKNQPGDLDIVKKELLKINGFFNVLFKKIGSENFQSRDLLELKSKIKNYLDNYYFLQEIDTMSSLYSEDLDRVKNLRLKIVEALRDRKLINKIEDLIEEL